MNEEYELDKKTYSLMKTWGEKFPDGKVKLNNSPILKSWQPLFDTLYKNPKFKSFIEDELSEELKNDKNVIVHPLPDLVFNAFNLTSFKKLKVVIIGQDPYFDHEVYKEKNVSQAMGLSFSVPHGIKVPSSLKNIYNNLKKFNHIKSIPDHGNLEAWAIQGCLLLNASLTVKDGTNNKNGHQYMWSWFTDDIISYISENKDHVIFVLWGAFALKKAILIDTKKHTLIISSHPSGLSCNKNMGEHPAFSENDHFGKINKQLKNWGLDEINWDNS